ncbi:MAG: stage V sporulation protein K [Dasosvirus sp.]|uniref:Stage V sporulation protein K n=1 Tax=Dasosvirus sp. TaxID=2487764 RepID=A0A3G4ZUD6_9VIRU|nr:MAG: stage V sporulation protein K [Dasosvirus sp.]
MPRYKTNKAKTYPLSKYKKYISIHQKYFDQLKIKLIKEDNETEMTKENYAESAFLVACIVPKSSKTVRRILIDSQSTLEKGLRGACRYGQSLEIIKFLVEKLDNHESDYKSNIILSLCKNKNLDIKILRYMVENVGIDIRTVSRKKGRNAFLLECAKEIPNKEILLYLQERGIDINQCNFLGRNAFLTACAYSSKTSILRYLHKLKINTDIIVSGENALMVMLRHNKLYTLDMVRFLIEELKISPHYLCNIGDNSFMELCFNNFNKNSLNVARYLAKVAKVNVHCINQDKNNAFTYACWLNMNENQEERLRVIKYLVEELEINTQQTNDDGDTGFLTSCRSSSSLPIVQYLSKLEYTDCQAISSTGDTALTYACGNNNPCLEVIRYLVEDLGISVNHVNNYGKDCYQILCSKHNPANKPIIDYLDSQFVKVTKTEKENMNDHRKPASVNSFTPNFSIDIKITPDTNIEVQSEIKSDIKNEVKSDIKNEIKSDTKNEVKSDIKNEVKSDIKNEIKSNTGSDINDKLNLVSSATDIKLVIDKIKQTTTETKKNVYKEIKLDEIENFASLSMKNIQDIIRTGKELMGLYTEKSKIEKEKKGDIWFYCYENKKYSINPLKIMKLVSPLEMLNNMIGMKTVKEEVFNFVSHYLQNEKDKNGKGNCSMLNTVIYGRPGVGKTEIGKILSQIYHSLEIISSNDFRLVKANELLGQYVGQTRQKTKEVLDKANGGVLFIDEVYSLTNAGKDDNYGKECIDTINQELSESRNKLIIIVAGYKKDIENGFFAMNEGLDRRFPFRYTLEKYTKEEMKDIFLKMISDNEVYLDQTVNEKDIVKMFENEKNFPNCGGDIENLITHIKFSNSLRSFGQHPAIRNVISKSDILTGTERYLKHQNHNKIDTVYSTMMYI